MMAHGFRIAFPGISDIPNSGIDEKFSEKVLVIREGTYSVG
jgi:hypothetical protein